MKFYSYFLSLLAATLCVVGCKATWTDADEAAVNQWQFPSVTSCKLDYPYSVWKGETINGEALFLYNGNNAANLEVVPGKLCGEGGVIPSDNISANILSFVIGDELAPGYGQCGDRDTVNFKAIRAADLITADTFAEVSEGQTVPVWFSVKVPADAKAGKYNGVLRFKIKGFTVARLKYSFTVIDKVLPPLSESDFHLDLWQNPYTVARFHNVPLWSEEHFEYMKPVFQKLADAGQKVITATIMDRPWNGQTEDPFGPMVTKTLKRDGSWTYDYSVFDKWVEFMMSLGIDSQINCYTMIPWSLSFDRFDEASGEVVKTYMAPGSKEYNAYWGSFIKDFASHLRTKGWFEKTHIAMDERQEEDMIKVLSLIKNTEPDFKVALAGSFHQSIADDINDLCITFRADYPEGEIERRRTLGNVSTYYTCCAERYPNTFIASLPSEASWLPIVVLQKGCDGYLRWAYNSWTIDPLHDARFRTWAAGDTYMVYPGGLSSVRFEKFVEGRRDYEKARILLSDTELNPEVAAELKAAVSLFTYDEITENGPAHALGVLRTAITNCTAR